MRLNWGIITAGHIAEKFAAGLHASKTGTLVATGARDADRAYAFARNWGGRSYGSYEEVLADPEVKAVYIATPHHLHAKWTEAAARAGKSILCEKPFTLNHNEAVKAIEVVKEKGVFFMEAFMYRCSPQTRKLFELVDNGAVGRVRAVAATFSYGSNPDRENFRTDAAVGGGGLLDVGTYCVSFARMIANTRAARSPGASEDWEEPSRVEYLANLGHGYDSYGAGVLQFPSGMVASIASGIHLGMRNDAMVYGEEGSIHIQEPWKSYPASLMTLTRYGGGQDVYSLGCTEEELYGHEADAVAEFRSAGECPYMTVADTLGNMKCLDELRAKCGLKFAAEPL